MVVDEKFPEDADSSHSIYQFFFFVEVTPVFDFLLDLSKLGFGVHGGPGFINEGERHVWGVVRHFFHKLVD